MLNNIKFDSDGLIIYPIIGYKKAKIIDMNIAKYVVITLKIYQNATTNINRNNIEDIECATYITNCAEVINIEDKNGINYNEAESGFYKKKIIYKKNKFIRTYSDIENGIGIYFLLSKQLAMEYGKKKILNGQYLKTDYVEHDNKKINLVDNENKSKFNLLYQIIINNKNKLIKFNKDILTTTNVTIFDNLILLSYYPNGQIAYKITYNKNMLATGNAIYYDVNGVIFQTIMWNNGNINGVRYIYYNNSDSIKYKINYINNEIHGLVEKLYINGNILNKYNYVHGKLMGSSCSYYNNNALHFAFNFNNNEFEGEQLIYELNNTLKSRINYSNGKIHGEHIEYYSNGLPESLKTYVNNKICGMFKKWWLKSNTNQLYMIVWITESPIEICTFKTVEYYHLVKPYFNNKHIIIDSPLTYLSDNKYVTVYLNNNKTLNDVYKFKTNKTSMSKYNIHIPDDSYIYVQFYNGQITDNYYIKMISYMTSNIKIIYNDNFNTLFLKWNNILGEHIM